MTWSRWELGQKSIFYDTCIRSDYATITPIPPHVEALRRSMLDFSCGILNHKDGPGGIQRDQTQPSPREQAADPALTAAHQTLNKAKSIHQGGYAEKRWENFFQSQFFEPLALSASVSKRDSRRVSRCNYYYDSFRTESNEMWDLFRVDTPSLYDFASVKCPKPDYAFYLPMYHLNNEPRGPIVSDPEARQWNQNSGTPLAEAFSWSDLKKLHSSGLLATPFRVFHKPPMEASLKCFPWLLVEHKKEGHWEEIVCCQAANGGACAVKLNQISARYAVELPEYAHVPPIPTVTTIGSQVKVWVTYFAKDFEAPCARRYVGDLTWKKRNRGYLMKAIWEGDMTELQDVVKFQMILENTHTWAMRVFKPLMASYIGQWKHIHCNVGIDAAKSALIRRQQTIERWQTIAPMLRDLLDYHSTIDLEDEEQTKLTPTFLGLLVQQIFTAERLVLTEEVDRLIAERLKPLSLALEKTITKNTTVETQESIRRASPGSDQSTLPSPVLANDGEDPNDDDYTEPNETCRSNEQDDEPEAAESELSRSTRSKPQMSSATQSHETPTYTALSEKQVTDDVNAEARENTTPSGSTTQEESSPATPKTYDHRTAESSGPSRSDSTTDIPDNPTPFSNSTASTGSTATKLFPLPPSASPLFGGLGRSPSPQPPTIDWEAPAGRVNFNYSSKHWSSHNSKLSSPGSRNESRPSNNGSKSVGKEPLIDLTHDSQDS